MNPITRRNFVLTAAAAGSAFAMAGKVDAQVPQYGADINLEQAKKAIAAGQEEARKNNWPVAIAPSCLQHIAPFRLTANYLNCSA